MSVHPYTEISQVSPTLLHWISQVTPPLLEQSGTSPLLQDQSGQSSPTPGSARSVLPYTRISQFSPTLLHWISQVTPPLQEQSGTSPLTQRSVRSVLPFTRISQVSPTLLHWIS
jgi:hypothetical protein